MIAWALAGAIAIGAFVASWFRLAHAARALRFDAAALAKTLGRRPCRSDLRTLATALRHGETESWEADLLEDLARTHTGYEAIAVANEHVHDLASELDWGAAIPSSAARLGLLGPMCVVFFVTAGGRAPIDEILTLFVWSGVGALGPLWVGRAAREFVSARRLAADRLVASCIRATQSEPDGPGGSPVQAPEWTLRK